MCPSKPPQLPRTSPAVGEKDQVLWHVWVCVQLQELHPHLSCWVHHILLHQWLWMHRNQLPARQGECVFGRSTIHFWAVPVFSLLLSAGVCGWRRGSPSRERMGGRVREVQLHSATGQRHIAAHCSVYPACVWSELPSGERHTTNIHVMLCYVCVNSHIFIAINFRAPRTLHPKESAVGRAHQPAVWSQREWCEGTRWLEEASDMYVCNEITNVRIIKATNSSSLLFSCIYQECLLWCPASETTLMWWEL